jgi:polyisoprenoid-binding protein YceI
MVSRITGGLLALVVASSTALGQAKSSANRGPSEKPHPGSNVHYVVAPQGNEARYRVREQLVGLNLPNDATGATQEIAGALVVDANGNMVRDSSKIVVTLTSLKSDKERRDNYIRRHTMETEKSPTVELVPTAVKGLIGKPTGASPTSFELLGDLTVHGVTHPTTWKVTAHADGGDIVGSATTVFTFKDFSLDQPKVPVVLSVQDTIKLEYDFRFTAAGKQ